MARVGSNGTTSPTPAAPASGDQHVTTFRATFQKFAMSARGDGYIVTFFADDDMAAEMVKLPDVHGRIVEVCVTRYSRRGKKEVDGNVVRASFGGADDD